MVLVMLPLGWRQLHNSMLKFFNCKRYNSTSFKKNFYKDELYFSEVHWPFHHPNVLIQNNLIPNNKFVLASESKQDSIFIVAFLTCEIHQIKQHRTQSYKENDQMITRVNGNWVSKEPLFGFHQKFTCPMSLKLAIHILTSQTVTLTVLHRRIRSRDLWDNN